MTGVLPPKAQDRIASMGIRGIDSAKLLSDLHPDAPGHVQHAVEKRDVAEDSGSLAECGGIYEGALSGTPRSTACLCGREFSGTGISGDAGSDHHCGPQPGGEDPLSGKYSDDQPESVFLFVG